MAIVAPVNFSPKFLNNMGSTYGNPDINLSNSDISDGLSMNSTGASISMESDTITSLIAIESDGVSAGTETKYEMVSSPSSPTVSVIKKALETGALMGSIQASEVKNDKRIPLSPQLISQFQNAEIMTPRPRTKSSTSPTFPKYSKPPSTTEEDGSGSVMSPILNDDAASTELSLVKHKASTGDEIGDHTHVDQPASKATAQKDMSQVSLNTYV